MSTPLNQNTLSLQNLLNIANSLPDAESGGGSGSLPAGVSAIDSGTFTPTSDTNTVSVNHGLGATPSFWVIVPVLSGFTTANNAGYVYSVATILKQFTVGSATYKGRYSVNYASSTGSIISGLNSQVTDTITATDTEFTAYCGTSCKFKSGVEYRWIACVCDDFD